MADHRAILVAPSATLPAEAVVPVRVDRHTLAKRRWRAVAEDGTAVAVALPEAVRDGTTLEGAGRVFQVAQEEETVVAIPLPDGTAMAAKIGWYLGNRHIPVEVRDTEIVVEAFPTLTASLERIGIDHEVRTDVLRCGAHSSGHRH